MIGDTFSGRSLTKIQASFLIKTKMLTKPKTDNSLRAS